MEHLGEYPTAIVTTANGSVTRFHSIYLEPGLSEVDQVCDEFKGLSADIMTLAVTMRSREDLEEVIRLLTALKENLP